MRTYTLRGAAPPPTRLALDSSLNAEQRAVVLAPSGAALVLAGAGTGKTRTLVYRVARLLETGTPPESILLLTFTNRAAREMLSRASALVGTQGNRLWGGTFHHVGHRLLREFGDLTGLGSDFGVLDREDAQDLMQACIAEQGHGVGQRRFPTAEVVLDVYSAAVNRQRPVVDLLSERSPQFLIHEDAILQVCRRYVERKRTLRMVDFDDLLLQWKALLVEHPTVTAHLQRRFQAILVDEYQDVNRLQADIVDILAAAHRNLLVVGDDAQSIYGFRGAHVESMLRFPERYPEARTYPLTVNYRSTGAILSVANASIALNTRQFQKELRPVREGGHLPALVEAADVYQQAAFIAQRVLELRDEGVPLKEMAVLYRAHGHSMELQMQLTRQGIPYRVRSGVRFFEQAHIKDLLALLRFVDNPADELAFKRWIKLFPGIGSVTADTLWTAVDGRRTHGIDPRSALDHAEVVAACGARARPGLARAARLVAQLSLPAYRASPATAIQAIIDEGTLRESLRARFPEAANREDDIAQLAHHAQGFESLTDFLADVTLSGELRGEDAEGAPDPDEMLTLSTIHQAKGLEWRAVFVPWVAEGRFPSPVSLRTTESMEEERRLFYVAVTRARDELYLVHPRFHQERDRTRTILRPSRFVSEVEADDTGEPRFERWTLDVEGSSDPMPFLPESASESSSGRLPVTAAVDLFGKVVLPRD